MEAKNIFKWAAVAAVILIGTVYLASALLISDKIASLVDFNVAETPSFRIVEDNAALAGDNKESGACVASGGSVQNDAASGAIRSGSAKPSFRIEVEKPGRNLPLSLIPLIVKLVVFAVFLLTPIVILHVFLIRPVRDVPVVEPATIRNLDSAEKWLREEAGTIIANAMLSVKSCSEKDREMLMAALARPTEIDRKIKEILAEREKAAKRKAVEIAAMAGLTMAVSSSSLGDGLGMFFWKSKLVYDTFLIYGFRPKAATAVSIWAHVAFASFFAASLEELCELFDISEFAGGFAVRLVQGVAGAAIVLKGGSLARTYIAGGVSTESRSRALAEFRAQAKDDLSQIGSAVTESLGKIGFKG